MIYIDRTPIVIVQRGARRAMRTPVRVFDGGRVIVIVVVVRRQMDVRRRQQSRDDSRGDEQRGSNGTAEARGNHDRRILAQEQ